MIKVQKHQIDLVENQSFVDPPPQVKTRSNFLPDITLEVEYQIFFCTY